MDLPQITAEQRKRFEAEFDSLDAGYISSKNIWCLARAYSEQLQLEPYPCQQCGADTVNVAEPPEVDLQCPKCKWRPVEVQVLSSASSDHQPRPEMIKRLAAKRMEATRLKELSARWFGKCRQTRFKREY